MKRFLICIIIFCAIASIGHAEERWALLVGIDQYSSEIITPLRGAVSDAQGLRDVLIKYARFPADNIFCLTSDDKSNLPNLGNIVTKLDYISSKAQKGDLFLFFFAGHGVTFENQNYLLAYESDIRPLLLPKTGLSVEELNEYLSKIQSGNTILILDACRNSPGAGRGDEDNLLSESFVNSLNGIGLGENSQDVEFRSTIYSCNTGERAYEWPGKGRGFFTLILEEALKGGADEDGDGQVTISEVEMYLGTRVPDLVKRELGVTKKQTPRIVRSGDPRAGSKVFSWASHETLLADPMDKPKDEIVASRELVKDEVTPSGHEVEPLDLKEIPKQSPTEEIHVPDIQKKETTQQESTVRRIGKKASGLFQELELPSVSEVRKKTSGFFEELQIELEMETANDEPLDSVGLTERQKTEGWIEVTGECYGANMIASDAQKKALDEARQKILIRLLGGEARIQELLKDWEEIPQDFQQIFPSLTKAGFYKGVIQEMDPIWSFDKVQANPEELPVPIYRVTLRAKKISEKVLPDPDFVVSIKLDKEVFHKGENLVMSITPSEYCYLTVFNVLSDGTILMVYPKNSLTQKIVAGEKAFSIPSQQNEYLPVILPAEKTEDTGSLVVIATKYNIPFRPKEAKEFQPETTAPDGMNLLIIYKVDHAEIDRWLSGIQLYKRTFDVKQYKIEEK